MQDIEVQEQGILLLLNHVQIQIATRTVRFLREFSN